MIDIETAFLCGELEEEISMTMPEGLELVDKEPIPEDMCAKLQATMHGLVQAAKMFWKALMKCSVTDPHFTRSCADPCSLVEHDKKMGPILFCACVDDVTVWGSSEARAWVKSEIKKTFDTKESEHFDDYFGANIIKTNNVFLLRQDEIIEKLDGHFGKEAEKSEKPMHP